MGNVTKEFNIWTPDEDNAVEPDVYLSQMADSIENGLGKRLLKQEQRAYLRTAITRMVTLDSHTLVRLPIYKTAGEGITVNGDMVEIQTDGLYFLTPTIGTSFSPGNFAIDYVVRLNGEFLEQDNGVTTEHSYTTLNINMITPLYKGDKLWLEARIGNPGGEPEDATILVRTARFHIAMLHAF